MPRTDDTEGIPFAAIAESGYSWVPAAVAAMRDTTTLHKSRRRDRDWAFSAAKLIHEFGADPAEVRTLPRVGNGTIKSPEEREWRAKSARLVERWEAEDWKAARSGGDDDERPQVRPAASLRPAAALDWLAAGRVPAAAVTLLVGDEGIGKSLFWAWLAAFITTGKPCPEYGIPARDPAHVFVVATEDDWSTAVRPRLEVAGVDLDYVSVICADDDGGGAPTFPRDIDVLESAEVTPALVIVDAWLDTVPAGLQVRDPQQARQALHPWREYAASTRAAVLLLTHTNRVATANARDKYGITSELRKKARSTLFAQADSDHADCVLIGPEKSNIAGQSPADRFRIAAVDHFEPTDSSDGRVPRLTYVESAGVSSRELIASAFNGPADDDDDSDMSEAVNWLTDYLTENGRTQSKTVKNAAKSDGISERTLKRAAEKMKRTHELLYVSEGFPRLTYWELVGGPELDAAGKPEQGDDR